jgi:hypothetical protein
MASIRSMRASIVIVLSLVAMVGSGVVPAAAASRPYNVGRFHLNDICTDGLPWTNDAPLSLPARRPRDKRGVPMIIKNGRRHYWVGALAINSMKRIDAYRDHGNEQQLQQALEQVRRLRILTRTRRNADWVATMYDYLPQRQRAPWHDAMVQGLTLSLYTRLYHVTGDRSHLDAADEIFKSFLRLGKRKSPWVAYVDGRRNLWLEHYPRQRPGHILNAHMHALIGLYEYWQTTRSTQARTILKGAITTMKVNGHKYRRPGGLSYYGIGIPTAHAKYHEIHIWQLHLLAKISGDRYFQRLAAKMNRDSPQRGYVVGRPAVRAWSVVGPHCRPKPPPPA